MTKASSIDPKISSGGDAAGGGGQTAPLHGLGDWLGLPFFQSDWPRIKVAIEAEPRTILPPSNMRFKAFELTQPKDTNVVILGQDPYPTPGHAMGLAFSVARGTPLPKSLQNIYTEMQDDLGACPETGDLSHWALSGVLLLNTSLSVPAQIPGGHARLGWSALTAQVIQHLNDRPRAFLLWGKQAQFFEKYVQGSEHFILRSAHPSPLSAYRGFFGSRPFSQINAWLRGQDRPQVNWSDHVSGDLV